MTARGASGRAALAATLVLLGGPASPPPAAGQEPDRKAVEFTPRSDRPAERRLDRFIEERGYRLWDADTTVARGDTVRGDVLVLESMVRVEGRVEGTLAAVDSDLFLEPRASLTGDLLVLGGGIYRSSLASVGGEVVYEPALRLQAVPRGGGYVLRPATARPDAFDPDGLSGLRLPTAQRVDGWSLGVGARARAVDLGGRPSLHLSGSFHTGGERIVGSARQFWYPADRWRVGVEGGRGTRTMEGWIRSDPANTLTHLFGGDDYRNYHESDRVRFSAKRGFGGGEALALKAGWERVRSLQAREAGGLFGDETVEPNPVVEEGDVWHVLLEAEIRREAASDSLAVDLGLEGADASVAGDFSYLFAEARLDWEFGAVRDHRLRLRARARGDLAGDLPGHRWSAIGGAGTLPALERLQLRGPRLLFGRVTYLVPLPLLRVPRLGGPEILLRAAAGAAWREGGEPTLHESLVAGARFLIFEGGVALDPGGGPGGEARGFFTVRLPR